MDCNPSKKQFITSVAIASLGLLALIAFAVETLSQIGSVGALISESENAMSGVESALKTKKQINQFKEEISTLDSFFVFPGEEAYFAEDIESIAKSHGVEVEIGSISLKPSPAADDFKEIIILDMKYEGSFSQVTRFLKSLESMPKAVRVDDLSISSSQETTSLWSGTASIYAYKLKTNNIKE